MAEEAIGDFCIQMSVNAMLVTFSNIYIVNICEVAAKMLKFWQFPLVGF